MHRGRFYSTSAHSSGILSFCNFFAHGNCSSASRLDERDAYGIYGVRALKGVPLGAIVGLVGDQQGALIDNKCLTQGEAKCTCGTGAFFLFCMATNIVYNNHRLLSMVRKSGRFVNAGIDSTSQVAYGVGSQGRLSVPWKEPVSKSLGTGFSMLCK